MKMVPTLALVAALSMGGAAIVATPAVAKDKKADSGQKPPALSAGAQKAAADAQKALTDKNLPAAETAVSALEAAQQTDDDKYYAAMFRVNLESMKLQAAGASSYPPSLAGPLDVLIASPRTDKEMVGKYASVRAQIALSQKQYPQALAAFQKAKDAGNTDPNLTLQIAQAKIQSGDVAGGLTDLKGAIDAEKAAGRKPPESWYQFGVATANKAKSPQTVNWLRDWVGAYPSANSWHDTVAILGFSSGMSASNAAQKNIQIDLYRLMRANKALLDQTEYLIYARYAGDIGLPFEAKAVIDEGRASGKIPASQAEANLIYTPALQAIKDVGSPAALEKKVPPAAGAATYLSAGDYPNAIRLYKVALAKGGDTDLYNMNMGIALALSGDKAAAKTALAAVNGAAYKDAASLWMLYCDIGAPSVTTNAS